MKIAYPKILFFIPLPILSLLYTRGLPTITSILSCILIFQIVSLSTQKKLYSILSLLIFISWGIFSINFNSPIVFSLTFGLLMCFLFLYFSKTSKTRYLFLAGISAFIAVIFYKYLFFLILVPPFIFAAFLPKGKIINLLTFSYGYIWGFILFAVYLLISNSFPSFVNNLLLFREFHISFENTTFQILMTFFLPFILCFLSFFLLFKRQRFHLLFLPSFAAIFSLSIIPNFTNPNYLNLAVSLSGILFSILMRYSANSTVKVLCIIFSVLLILNGAIMRYG